ncbi:hypothetical protein [Lysinibacillus fusiformis]|uniref:hypothetical protein n=1 Tax=Lysinibacillus fusiformis TaxID=28031 RepID=UPI003555CFD2
MDRNEFHKKLHSSKGMMFIVTGLTALVEEEGYTPHEALDIAKTTGQECYFALNDIYKEAKDGVVNDQP